MHGWTAALALLLPLTGLADPSYLRLKRAEIIDRHGFEKPLPAMSVLIPVGWTFEGEVKLAQRVGDPADLVKLVFRTASPDGRLAIELFPSWNWSWVDDPMMRQAIQNQDAMAAQLGRARTEMMPPMTARDFLSKVAVPRLRPGAKLLGIEPIPDLDQALQSQVKQAEALAAQAGLQTRLRADQARARIQLPSGKLPAEEWITAVVFTRASAMPTMTPATGQMVQSAMYQSSAESLYGLRAPPGELPAHEKLFRTVLSTVRVDPAWQARVTQVQATMQATQLQGARDRSRIIAQSAEDTRRSIREGYEARQKSADRNAERWSDAMRGLQTYRNPTTGEDVKLSNQYAHAWASGNGEYVMSDTPGFNPGQVLQGNWTELQPVKR
jgi:hypothetical protein